MSAATNGKPEVGGGLAVLRDVVASGEATFHGKVPVVAGTRPSESCVLRVVSRDAKKLIQD